MCSCRTSCARYRSGRLPEADLRGLGEVPLIVLTGPAGSYVAEQLAGSIAHIGRWPTCVWLRTAETTQEGLARELAEACRHRWGSGTDLRAILRAAPRESVVVVEVELRAVRAVRRIVAGLEPLLAARRICVVVVAEPALPWSAGRPVGLPSDVATRLRVLAGRRPAVLADVAAAESLWGGEPVAAVVAGTRTLRALLDRLTARLLERCDPGQLAALRALLDTGYWHPSLTAPEVGATHLRPWAVALEDGWCVLRPVWTRGLRRHLPARLAGAQEPAHRPAPAAPAPAPPILAARLFGDLEVRVDGRQVDRWSGQRGSGVLRLLLSRPHHACSRDELLATFWPDVDPAVARNRLQVAVSAVRKAFLDVTSVPVIEYAEGSYRINPALRVEVDVERFETGLAAARRADRAGDTAAALAAYAEATAWFRADFAVDAPFEAWTFLPRESLRMSHLDALDRMGSVQLALGALEDAVATGRRMLEVDPCREDAHRLVMRSQARLGRPYQALRQYEFCCRVLRSTLDVGPAPATVRLHEEIRAGLLVAPRPA